MTGLEKEPPLGPPLAPLLRSVLGPPMMALLLAPPLRRALGTPTEQAKGPLAGLSKMSPLALLLAPILGLALE